MTNLIIYYMYIFIARLLKYFFIFNYEIFYKIQSRSIVNMVIVFLKYLEQKFQVFIIFTENWVTSSDCLVIAQNKKYTLRTTVQLLKFAYNCFTIFIVVQKEAKNRENESILYIPYNIGCI